MRRTTRRRVRRRRLAGWLSAGLLVWLAACLVFGLRARADLTAGRDAMRAAADAATAGDLPRAARLFALADDRFRDAAGSADALPLRVAGWLPWIGRTPDALSTMCDIGRDLAEAGRTLTAAMSDRGGVSAFAPRAGRIPIAPLLALREPTHRARVLVDRARAELETVPTSLVLPQVGGAREELAGELDRGARLLQAADGLMTALPWFLGEDGPRRYFVGAQNPAELRGTGGLIGVHSVLTVHRGRMRLGAFQNSTGYPPVPDSELAEPPPDFARRYGGVGAAGLFANINLTPDLPSATQPIEALLAHWTGEEVDGVVLIDPVALRYMLEATGPVRVPGVGVTVDAEDVVDFTTNEVYTLLPGPRRKVILGEVAEAVWARFLTDAEPLDAIRALTNAASEGHLKISVDDPVAQAGFRQAGITGELHAPVPAEDFFAVFASNTAGNKIDFFGSRTVSYRMRLLPGGAGVAEAAVTIRNDAPTTGEPPYVIGPNGAGTPKGPDPRYEAGESESIVSLYCGTGCGFSDPAVDGRDIGLEPDTELGQVVLSTYLSVPSERERTLAVTLEHTNAWTGDELSGTYTLTVQGQTMLRPAESIVEVTLPPGMHFRSASPGAVVTEDTVRWTGPLPGVTRSYTVTFARSPLGQLWQRARDFLARPVA